MSESRMIWLSKGPHTHLELLFEALGLGCAYWTCLDAPCLATGAGLPQVALDQLPCAIFWLSDDDNLYYVGKLVKEQAAGE